MEGEARDFIKKMTGKDLPAGKDRVHAALKSGEVLAALANKLQPGSVNYKPSTMPFKQMEAIGQFLVVAGKYLPSRELFMTVDLYENQNMAQVVLCIANLKRTTGN